MLHKLLLAPIDIKVGLSADMSGEHGTCYSLSCFCNMLKKVADAKQAAHLHDLSILYGICQPAGTQATAHDDAIDTSM